MNANLPQPVAITSQDDDASVNYREYLQVILKHKWGILAFVLGIALLSMPIIYSMTPIYRSQSTLLIETTGQNIIAIEDVYGYAGRNREYLKTQFRILQSRMLIERVVDKLDLTNHQDFVLSKQPLIDWKKLLPENWLNDSDIEIKTREKGVLVSYILSNLQASLVSGTQLIEITYQSHKPEYAQLIANTVAEAYIEDSLESRLAMVQKAGTWLTERLDVLREKLEQSEVDLQAYKEREGLLDVQGVKGLSSNRVMALTSSLMDAQQKRTEAAAVQRQVTAAKRRGLTQLSSIPAVLNHSAVQEYRRDVSEAERKKEELSKRYGPKHPKMIQAVADLGAARQNLQRQVQHIVDTVQRDYEVAYANERDIKRQLEQAKQEVQGIDQRSAELNVLQREVEANRSLYDLFLKRFKETNETEGLQPATARILDAATLPTSPFEPDVNGLLTKVILVSALIAVMLAFIYEHLNNTIRHNKDLEDRLGLPALGALPKLKTKGKGDRSPMRAFMEDEQTGFSELVRTIRTGVLLSNIDSPKEIVVVTSSIPGEGKSTVALNMAAAMAKMSSVLLIDADMRRPSIATAMEYEPNAKGLSQYAAGTADISHAVRAVPGSKLHVMPAGIIPPNPLELLSSQKFSKALESLSKAFDHIVIDSAPALAVSDALVLSQHATSVVYVVKSDSTPYPMAQNGIKRLKQVGAPLIGAVLNMVRPDRHGYYGKYNYSGEYYTEHTYSQS